MRVFFAHRKQEEKDSIEFYRTLLSDLYPGDEIVIARDEFALSMSAAGTVETWARDIGAGWDIMRGGPRFDLIACPRQYVGIWTAWIVEAALSARRPVVYWDGSDMVPVQSVVAEDPESYEDGWRLDSVGV
jgi:hypothetical protein